MNHSAGILSDSSIIRAVTDKQIEIDPFEIDRVNPASYDLTLGDEVKVYASWVGETTLATTENQDGTHLVRLVRRVDEELDSKVEPKTRSFTIDERGWVLRPGILYLMHTRETVWTESYVSVIDGKSSIGRLGICVHLTAGYGDPGFRGQYTLEVTSLHRVRVYAGMRIAQIRFHTISGQVQSVYHGNYTGKRARGPVASRAWRQFDVGDQRDDQGRRR